MSNKKIKSFSFTIPIKVTNIIKIPAPNIYMNDIYKCNVYIRNVRVWKEARFDADNKEMLKEIIEMHIKTRIGIKR